MSVKSEQSALHYYFIIFRHRLLNWPPTTNSNIRLLQGKTVSYPHTPTGTWPPRLYSQCCGSVGRWDLMGVSLGWQTAERQEGLQQVTSLKKAERPLVIL